MSFDASIHAKAVDLIKLALEMTSEAGSGHPTSAASLAHLTAVLMYQHMRFDPAEPDAPAADRLVISEGHACPIIYAAAADLGIAIETPEGRRPMTRDDALSLREIDSPVDGHPNPAEGFPFFPAATGSLGQGLSVAAGLALASRLNGIPNRVFCLIGDGEAREGQIIEALDFLIDLRLQAVCPIFNCNGLGQSTTVSPQQSPESLAARLLGTGFDVRVIDGHDPTAIRDVLEAHAAAEATDAPPVAVIARTQKGWGFDEVLDGKVHGKAVPADRVGDALAELDAKAAQLGAAWNTGDVERLPLLKFTKTEAEITSPPPSLGEAAAHFDQASLLDKGKLSPRKAFGLALRALGRANPDTVVLDGDVRNSTYSEMFSNDPHLCTRLFQGKIAEQNMVSCAAGLTAGGKTAFVATFGKFLVRAYDQTEMALISRAPLKLVGSHAGASVAADGPSQMALSDVAFFRALTTVEENGEPLVHLLNPADAHAAYGLTLAMAEHPGACYLRTMRPTVPMLYDDQTAFHLRGHHLLAEGDALLIVATGYMVHEALKAVDKLHAQNVRPTLVDLYALPPDADALVDLARQNGGRVLTVEDNYGGSFGSAVADVLAAAGDSAAVKQMHVRRLPKSGRSPDDLLDWLGLSADHIVQAATEHPAVFSH